MKLTLEQAKEFKWCFDQHAAILSGAREYVPMNQIEAENKIRFAIQEYEDGQEFGNRADQERLCSFGEIGEDSEVSYTVPPWYEEGS